MKLLVAQFSSVQSLSRVRLFATPWIAQSRATLCSPMDCSLPGFFILENFQARILEWVAISFSRGASWPRDQTEVSRIAGRLFTVWAIREVLNNTVQISFAVLCYPWVIAPNMNFATTSSIHKSLRKWQMHNGEWPITSLLSKPVVDWSVQFGSAAQSGSTLRLDGLRHSQASLFITNSRSFLKLMSIESLILISSSVVPFSSRRQSFPASGSFSMSQFFASGGQSVGVSASASVLPVNTQDWSPFGIGHHACCSIPTQTAKRVVCVASCLLVINSCDILQKCVSKRIGNSYPKRGTWAAHVGSAAQKCSDKTQSAIWIEDK